MKQRLFITIGYLMITNFIFSQTNIQEINNIKRNKNCIYAEATLATEQEASKLAQELLVKYIEDYLKEDSLKGSYPNYVVKDIVGKSEKLLMNRGEMVRVFLYVKKEDVIPAKNVMTLQREITEQITEKNMKESSVQEKVQPKNEYSTSPVVNRPYVITELLNSKTAKDALATLDRLKSEYKVKRYGAYRDCKNISVAYWLILNEDNTICAILSKGDEERIDYVTNTHSSLKAYSGKTAVWFTLSDN